MIVIPPPPVFDFVRFQRRAAARKSWLENGAALQIARAINAGDNYAPVLFAFDAGFEMAWDAANETMAARAKRRFKGKHYFLAGWCAALICSAILQAIFRFIP